MKKLIALVLLICIMCGCASAESGSDVSTSLVAPSTTEPPVESPSEHLFRKARWKLELADLSLDQLVDMQQLLTAAMWATEEWQSVEVPAGVYKIGQDIPAGYWTISRKSRSPFLVWGSALDDSKTDIASGCMYSCELVDGDAILSVSWELTEGSYLVISNAPAVFTPFAGITLGFK